MIQSRLRNRVLEDVDGTFTLFVRRQISLDILQINVGKAAGDLRVIDSAAAEALEQFHADLLAIDRGAAFLEGLEVYQAFRAWRRSAAEPVAAAPAVPERPHLVVVSDADDDAPPAPEDPDWLVARAEVEALDSEAPIVSPEELAEAMGDAGSE